MTRDTEQAELLHAFFAPVFTGKSNLQELQVPAPIRKGGSEEELPLTEEIKVRA